ncbi:MAG: CBS domain-containing protein [Candidatus Margulisbacteria bacterium]|nr:CBS domain-containing protein [Candidatus Margulisiibacteriota bacterium]
MVLFSEMFISDLKKVPVVDRLQEPVGEVRDFILTVGDVFPKITGLLVKVYGCKNGCQVILMAEIDLIGKQFVATRTVKDRIVYTKLRHDELLLRRDLLDKQIVDTEGARVIRVNDLKLAKVDQDVRLIAADVGFRGLLRRLRVLPLFTFIFNIFGKKVPDILIGWDHVEQLKTGRTRGMITVPKKHLSEMHPADIANVISQVHSEEKTAIFTSLSEKTAAESLHELEPKIQALLLMTVDTKKAMGVISKMPLDEVADVLGDLPQERAEEFIRLMKPKRAAEVRKLMSHPEETAGGLMTTEYIAVLPNMTIQQTIDHIRQMAPNAETIYYIYIKEESDKLVGVLTVRELIVSAPETIISQIMEKDLITVEPEMDQKNVAEVISKYNLLAVPVIDKENKILGIVTVDDVIDFILPPVSRRIRHMLG